MNLGGSLLKPSITQRAVAVIRVGRKRKAGKRHPNGELVNEQKQIDLAHRIAITQPHRQSVSESLRFDQKAGTELGRLRLRGILTEEQYEAGRKYNALVTRYRASIDAPKAGQSIAGAMEPRGGGVITLEAAREIKREYDGAFEALFDCGQPAAKLVAHVAVHDREIDRHLHATLICGLSGLAKHFGLTNERKSHRLQK